MACRPGDVAGEDAALLAGLSRELCLVVDGRGEIVGSPFGAAPAPGLVGRAFSDLVHREDAAFVADIVKALRAGMAPSVWQSILSFDGVTWHCFECRATPRFDSRGARDGFCIVLRDLSDERRSEHEFERIVEESVHATVVHRNGQPLYANRATAALLGMADRQAVMQMDSVLDFIHPDDRAMIDERYKARMAGLRAPVQYEMRLIRADGVVIWVDCRAAVINWRGNDALLVNLFDITTRKAAEEERRNSEQLLAKVFDSSPEIITLTRRSDGRFISINRTFLETLRYRREEVIGHTSQELGIWVDQGERDAILADILAKGRVVDREATIRRADDSRLEIAYSVETLDFGGEDLLLIVARDITERKLYERQLRESKAAAELANRAKGEFLANMSHELRTPLNAIIGFSEVLRDQLFGPIGEPRYLEYAGDIYTSGKHLLDIINDILDLSKLEAGKFQLHEAVQPLSETVDACVRLIRERAREADLSICLDLPGDAPLLRADHRHLKQVLLNLLSNAVKFTPAGGVVAITVAPCDDGGWSVAVSDNGIGMSAGDIDVALTPFGQVDSSMSRRHQGSGLGLPLARTLMERHGGSLTIESEIHVGTTIRMTVPASRVVARRK
ncbi:PAS domain S-box protein [Oceanibacterium hippocampi]|uniref:PAS domain S-box protein n=1 Tax=Oceanibacterium hippocampi TaxID=745714 RepID=UPI001592B702|nr:PAS domain S-box protein [Oceanibacterium hippocampi]